MTKTKKLVWILAVIGAVLAVTIYVAAASGDGVRLPTKWDLRGKDMYVHNVTCNELHEMRTVDAAESRDFCRDVLSLCTKTEKFRPQSSMTDVILGGKSEGYIRFEDEKERYTIEFFDVEKQLDVGFVHRETPTVIVAKDVFDENGNVHSEWTWRCTMTAADYTTLYNLLQTYSGGEKIK